MDTILNPGRRSNPFSLIADSMLIGLLRPFTRDGQVVWIRLVACTLSLLLLVGVVVGRPRSLGNLQRDGRCSSDRRLHHRCGTGRRQHDRLAGRSSPGNLCRAEHSLGPDRHRAAAARGDRGDGRQPGSARRPPRRSSPRRRHRPRHTQRPPRRPPPRRRHRPRHTQRPPRRPPPRRRHRPHHTQRPPRRPPPRRRHRDPTTPKGGMTTGR